MKHQHRIALAIAAGLLLGACQAQATALPSAVPQAKSAKADVVAKKPKKAKKSKKGAA